MWSLDLSQLVGKDTAWNHAQKVPKLSSLQHSAAMPPAVGEQKVQPASRQGSSRQSSGDSEHEAPGSANSNSLHLFCQINAPPLAPDRITSHQHTLVPQLAPQEACMQQLNPADFTITAAGGWADSQKESRKKSMCLPSGMGTKQGRVQNRPALKDLATGTLCIIFP